MNVMYDSMTQARIRSEREEEEVWCWTDHTTYWVDVKSKFPQDAGLFVFARYLKGYRQV